jgi:hypothetical protein
MLIHSPEETSMAVLTVIFIQTFQLGLDAITGSNSAVGFFQLLTELARLLKRACRAMLVPLDT